MIPTDQAHAAKLRKKLDELLAEAQRLANELEQFCYIRTADDEYYEEEDLLALQLKDTQTQLVYVLMSALESMGFHELLRRLSAWFDSEDWKPTDLRMAPWIGEFYNPALNQLHSYLSALEPYLPDSSGEHIREYNRERLRKFLLSTPSIIRDAKIIPSKEKDVQDEVYRVMRYAFPDAERELTIKKTLKNCKPDFGVRSLGVAIEYKFVDSEQDLKTHLGGIYEDIHGYAGSSDWTSFIGIIYMTDAFCTPAQLESEIALSNVPDSWEVLAVTGKGARQKKKT